MLRFNLKVYWKNIKINHFFIYILFEFNLNFKTFVEITPFYSWRDTFCRQLQTPRNILRCVPTILQHMMSHHPPNSNHQAATRKSH